MHDNQNAPDQKEQFVRDAERKREGATGRASSRSGRGEGFGRRCGGESQPQRILDVGDASQWGREGWLRRQGLEVTPASANSSFDAGDDERRRIAAEVASRLRRRGVQLTGAESAMDLADLEEAVEEFERAVERSGGDLMVDEPVAGESPIAPG